MNFDPRLIKLLTYVKIPFLLTLLFSVLTAVVIIFQTAILSHIINSVFLNHQTLKAVSDSLLLFLLLSFLRALSRWSCDNATGQIARKIKGVLRLKVNQHLSKLGPIYLRSQRTGELSNTILTGIDALDSYFSQYLPQVVLAILIPGMILIFIFPLDLLSGIVLFLTAPLIPVFMLLIGSRAESLTKKQWKILSLLSAHFLDVLQGLTTLKIFGRSQEQIRHIADISEQFRIATMRVLRVAFLSALVLELIAMLSIAILAVEIGLRLLYGRMQFEHALFILILAPEFYQPMRQLSARFHSGMKGITAAQRIFQILETPALNKIYEGVSPKNISQYPIHFRLVSYSYPDMFKSALRDINFTIEPGQKVALIGASGSGKTTISYLLLRFIEPSNGCVLLDNQNIKEYDAENWRKRVSWISQSPYLFQQSIYNNIHMANPQATENDVIRSAQLAHIHDFINTLPQGYQTNVGERGVRLSGGEAQRVALARAFLKDAPIIILDEPTANLDPEIEREIQKSINELIKNKTAIIIAHRLSSVRSADKLLVLEQGRIVQTGSPTDLLKQMGPYRKLLKADRGYDEK